MTLALSLVGVALAAIAIGLHLQRTEPHRHCPECRGRNVVDLEAARRRRARR